MEIITFVLAFRFFGNSFSTLSDAIISYRVASVNNLTAMPGYLSFLLNVCLVVGYISGYIIVSDFILSNRINIKWTITWILGIINSLFGGSRGGSISIIVLTIGAFWVIYHRANNPIYNDDIRRKRRIRFFAIIGIFLGVFFFLNSSKWIGRTMEYTPAYYFAIYLSAPLKNLDINLSQMMRGQIITGRAYSSINGLSLGNVGTVYTYEYQHGRILGVVGYSFLISLISSILYEIVRIKKIYSNRLNLLLIFYSYLFYCVSMVVFGSTMIISLFSLFFLKVVACLFIILLFLGLSLGNKGKSLIVNKII